MARSSRGTGRSGRGRSGTYGKRQNELKTVEGLYNYAASRGLVGQADSALGDKKKMSTLQRLSSLLSSFNPAEAQLSAREGSGSFLGTYAKNIAQGVGAAVTGNPYDAKRRYGKDVAEAYGIENKIAKFGIGFLYDVLGDPTTYFGGAIARGLTTATRATTGLGLRTIGRFAPDVEQGLRMAGTGVKDALGKAFKFGYKTSKGATGDVMSFLSKTQKSRLGLAASNLERLGTGTLTKEQSEEVVLRLIAGKRAEEIARSSGQSIQKAGQLARTTALHGANKTVSSAVRGQMARAQKFAGQLGLENPYEVYFPFIRKDKLPKFIEAAGRIRVGSQGYMKKFRNILKNEEIETDLARAFFTSESKQVTDRMTKGFIQLFTKKYGVEKEAFASVDDAMKAGYAPVYEKGIAYQGKNPIGYLNEWDAKLLQDGLSPEFKTIDVLAKATGFDAITSLFKRSVTGLFVPFHVRNYVSGMVQNFEALGMRALDPRLIATGQKIAYAMAKNTTPDSLKAITVAGKEVPFNKVFKKFAERFSGDTFYTADFEKALEAGSELSRAAGVWTKAAARATMGFQKGNYIPFFGADALPFRAARAVGQFIEHQQKATAYLAAIAKGHTLDDALLFAERAGFDYRALTRFESQILRRIIPFYSFTRKNIGLQLATLKENPQRINQIMRFFANNPLVLLGAEEGTPLTDEEKAALPDFLKESLGTQLQDTPEGLKQFVASFGTPVEAFAQLFGSNQILRGISMMNPYLKAPIELGIGKDSFRKKDLKDVYSAQEYRSAPQVIKDLLQIEEVEKPIMKVGSNGELIQVGTRTEYVANPERLLIARSLFTSRGVSYLDQVFNGDPDLMARFLKLTTGIKPTEVNTDVMRGVREKEQRRALEDMLLKYTELRKFETVYEPK